MGEFCLKERIYTIPITEAYEENSECPLCLIEKKYENEILESALGASVMEPDSRILSNEKGYCRKHYGVMQKSGKALSLSLLLDTHMEELITKMNGDAENSSDKKRLFAKTEDKLAQTLEHNEKSCVVCEKTADTLTKVCENFWYLYKTEADFKEKVLSSKGFCLPHFRLLLETLGKETGGKDKQKARREIFALEVKNLERIQDELRRFSKTFDYRYADTMNDTIKDSPVRAIEKLSKFQEEI